MNDSFYMRKAIRLAKKGAGHVNPNPLVGALLVKDDVILSEGYHTSFGAFHAERSAIVKAKQPLDGSTLYVTLEPCCHQGKTPPCTDIILSQSIARVVIGCVDPNPLMAGKSIALLKEAGILVTVGVLEKECFDLIRPFSKYITTGLPFVMLKYAMTMDGKIATVCGASRWISGPAARMNVQKSRNLYAAIMIGVNTVLTDDPSLFCHKKNGRNPIRIICDTNLRTPLSSVVVKTAHQTKTILATAVYDSARFVPYIDAGCEILICPKNADHIALSFLMKKLGEKHIDSILVEGGSALLWSILQEHLADCVQTYLSPLLLGGKEAPTPVGGPGISSISDAFSLVPVKIRHFKQDLLIESEVHYPCLPES